MISVHHCHTIVIICCCYGREHFDDMTLPLRSDKNKWQNKQSFSVLNLLG